MTGVWWIDVAIMALFILFIREEGHDSKSNSKSNS
jgi:hypothetical protein